MCFAGLCAFSEQNDYYCGYGYGDDYGDCSGESVHHVCCVNSIQVSGVAVGAGVAGAEPTAM